jgi:RIO-like serine/threonine protein kinase
MSDLERICKVPHGDLFTRNILVSEKGDLTVIDSGNPGYDYPGDQLLVAEDVSKITFDPDRKAVAWARNKLRDNWEYAAIAHGLQSGDGRPTAIFFYLLAEFCFAGHIESKKLTVSSS